MYISIIIYIRERLARIHITPGAKHQRYIFCHSYIFFVFK